MKNWKTSATGTGAILIGVTELCNDISDWKSAVPLIVVGIIGLLAKDHNVSGK